MSLLDPSHPLERLALSPNSLLTHPPTLALLPTSPKPSPAPPIPAPLLAHLHSIFDEDSSVSPQTESAQQPGPPSSTSAPDAPLGIHALGTNAPGLLTPFAPTGAEAEALARSAASARAASGGVALLGAGGRGQAVQPSLTQPRFRLNDVFNPDDQEDASLFGVDRDEEGGEDGDEEDSYGEEGGDEEDGDDCEEGSRGVGGNGVAVDVDELDAELDTLLGGDAAFWAASRTQKRAWKKRNASAGTGSSGGVPAGDVWASVDRMDVSDFSRLVPDPALEYPFDLDTFQRRAIFRLERRENVFVAAHTSAGKTVVAEYAIALARHHRTRVVFTSPIKTLSNQKFRDFTARFGDGVVGLITGDVSLNPDAPVLVMTTEILRSMLYRGADMVRDLEFVVFDEVHWASDPERGVVWEETIILLPEECGIVMLSATVPNALEFASWVGRVRKRPVFVVSTTHRPVPLVHSLFVRNEAFPLFHSTTARFQSPSYKSAQEKHKGVEKGKSSSGAAAKGRGSGRGGSSGGHQNTHQLASRYHSWHPLINYLRKNELDPAIIFCFSKRKCEEAAGSLSSLDLTAGAAERNQIHHFFTASIARLSPADQRVPQISRCRDALKRGIGVHHAGILPIVKEVTEVLFARGLVRILFCTETFAVGVNAPARTVVFSAIRKFDGDTARVLEPGEYTQMAGRAGRRGKDAVGTVLLYPVPADFPAEVELKQLLTGTPKRIVSQFRLTYNMILNLMRVDELRVEDVMSRSFSEAPAARDSTRSNRLLEVGERQLRLLADRAHELDRYRDLHAMLLRLRELSRAIAPALLSSVKRASSLAFEHGRVVLVDRGDGGLALAAVVKATTAPTAKLGLRRPVATAASTKGRSDDGRLFRVAILRGGPATKASHSPYFRGTDVDGAGVCEGGVHAVGGVSLELFDVPATNVHAFSMLKVSVSEQGMNPLRGAPRQEVLSNVAEQLLDVASDKGNWDSLPLLEAMGAGGDVGIKDADIASLWDERNELVVSVSQLLAAFAASSGASGRADADMGAAITQLSKEIKLRDKVEKLRLAKSDESLHLMPDFRQRVEVLRRLGYVEGGRVLLKGRAMCEVNTCELILIELVFENVLQGMSPASMAALLSTLVYQGGGGSNDDGDAVIVDRLQSVATDLHEGSVALRRILTSIGSVQAECGLPVSPFDYAESEANFGLAEAVYVWASGRPFVDVCDVAPDVAEGTIVRGIVRLSELLREAKNVGRVIGDTSLQELAEQAIDAVKRDVIFAASLYVT